MINDNDVLIVGYSRTPIGAYNGSLASIPAIELGAIAIQGALQQNKIDKDDVEEVFMGCVLSANIGQAPARQACIKAGLVCVLLQLLLLNAFIANRTLEL
jgi:acetyl-CoA C-acetyltransferase